MRFSQIWILILLILPILILLILKLKKVLVNLGKITKWSISLANFHFLYLKGARFSMEIVSMVSGIGFIFARFVFKGTFGQIWVKITELSPRFENFHFGAHFTNYSVPFCSF